MYNILSQKQQEQKQQEQTIQIPEIQIPIPELQIPTSGQKQPEPEPKSNNYPINYIQKLLNNLNDTTYKLDDETYDNIIDQLKKLSLDKIIKLASLLENINETPSFNIFKKYIGELILEKQKLNNINPDIAFKYIEVLISGLLTKKILDENDVNIIKEKLKSKLVSIEDIIVSLEKLKKYGETVNTKYNNDLKYNELPQDFFKPLGDKIANDWTNDYTILNTDKWKVPLQRPPLCINTNPCKVCPNDTNYPVNLKSWDDSRIISKTNINKDWISDQ